MTTIAASLHPKPDNLWSYVRKLLHLRQVTFVSGFKRAKPLIKALDIGLVLLAISVAVGCYLLSDAIYKEINTPAIAQIGINPAGLMDSFTSLLITAVFILCLMSSFRVLLQALYLSKDMDFLVSAPIPIRSVFLAKLLEAILPNFILVVVVGLPMLISLGVAREHHYIYYFILLVELALIPLAAAGISSLLVMGVVRLFPAKRVAEVLTFLGACLIILVSQSINLMGDKLENLSPSQIASGVNLATKLNTPLSPLAWGGRSLVGFGQGNWFSGGINLALMLVLSLVIFWVALGTAEKLYYTGWASLQVGTARKVRHNKINPEETNGNYLTSRFSSQVGALLLKDFRQIRRDLNNLSQVIGALIMGVVFGVMLMRAGGKPSIGEGDMPSQLTDILRSGIVYGSMLIGLFVGWAMLSRLALVAFSMEGRAYWILKTSPINSRKMLQAKFLMAYLPSLILAWLYLVAIAILQKPPLPIVLYGLPSLALILAGLCGINLALGVRSVNLTWTDPRKMENGVAGVLGTFLSIVYQLLTLVIFFAPPLIFPMIGISEEIGMLVGFMAGCIVTLISTFLPLTMIKNRVATIGEE